MTCSCGQTASFRRATPKHLLTTVGAMNVSRRYYACRVCKRTYTPWDAWAGVAGSIQATDHARKVIVAVSVAWSFDRAAAKLKQICQMRVSDDTIERVCQDEGERARKWLREAAGPVAASFARARGEPEFYSDGLKVNTVGGWREMRLNLLQKRERAGPATPQQWKGRVLPEAGVRLASCAIADSRLVGAMWKCWSRRLNLEGSTELSVIGDGAPWIWEQAAKRLSPDADWCVDVYHVSEHLHACGKALHGEGDAARAWAEGELEHLIAHGGPACLGRIDRQIQAADPQGTSAAALRSLRTYLHGNRDRMGYARRLAQGKAIGSGAIEGACKKIGARLKLNSARWRIKRAAKFGALLCMEYTGQTEAYWKPRAA